jgi:hypothetical protein
VNVSQDSSNSTLDFPVCDAYQSRKRNRCQRTRTEFFIETREPFPIGRSRIYPALDAKPHEEQRHRYASGPVTELVFRVFLGMGLCKRSSNWWFVSALGFLFISPLIADAQVGIVDRDATKKPSLVVLGTYHMGAPGNNVYNGKVDDISSPVRQKEIVKLVERLQKFRPTKVVVECDWDEDGKAEELYKQYLAGTFQLTKDETHQIGFRLAKASGLKKVHCVDWSDFWGDPTTNYIKYAAKDAELSAYVKKFNEDVERRGRAEDSQMAKLTVIDRLALLNRPSRIEKDHQAYYDIMRIGRGNDHVGAGYLSWWHRRNLVIFDKIIRLTDNLDERILVVYGAGHVKLLTQYATESGFYKLESPLRYLRKGS